MKQLPFILLAIVFTNCNPPQNEDAKSYSNEISKEFLDSTFHFEDSIDIGLYYAQERNDLTYVKYYINCLDTVRDFQRFMIRAYYFSERVVPWGVVTPDPKTNRYCEGCNEELVRRNYITGYRIFTEFPCSIFSSDTELYLKLHRKYFSFKKEISSGSFDSLRNDLKSICQ